MLDFSAEDVFPQKHIKNQEYACKSSQETNVRVVGGESINWRELIKKANLSCEPTVGLENTACLAWDSLHPGQDAGTSLVLVQSQPRTIVLSKIPLSLSPWHWLGQTLRVLSRLASRDPAWGKGWSPLARGVGLQEVRMPSPGYKCRKWPFSDPEALVQPDHPLPCL